MLRLSLLSPLLACLSLVVATAQADIVIGQSVPTTGVAAGTGKALALGASLYFGRINAGGGLFGEPIDHQVLDDGYDPKRTVANTQELVEKKGALALVSYYGTATTLELIKSKVLDNAGVPLVGVHSGAEAVRNPGDPFIFQTRASYKQEIDRLVQLLAGNLGVTRIAVVAQQDAYGQSGVDALKAALQKRNLTLTGEYWYDRATGDTTKAAQEAAKLNPEAVVLVAISKPAGTFIKKFKELGGTSQLYGLSPIQFEEVIANIGKKYAHGLGISQVYPYPGNAQMKFIREFQQDTDAVLRSGDYPSYAVFEGYLSAKLVVDAIKRAGKAPTRAGVYNALTQMHRYDLGGFVINFDEKNRLGSKFIDLTMISPTGTLTR
ncbi:ABC-type branched-chain amino acid transport system, substrate-binding protein [Andreprevotia lacus DSM 23236]|uniref:ABC-type branched-chain amino acid transport system, substrate-binding protein n=1 Tax=Andreprevotia lacus DSM 23236 TaxID=1121001 RepID=A0A1W1XY64_9NEIS|nr:ABC transporter substrate-binding protein [Andreprevotia lacus]SMC28804.1 ABC-type branched-chain amino acid transport system, substrate-binding protein [Andreprevotia lacus DSM 23236]